MNLVPFWGVFSTMPSYPLWVRPQICAKWKVSSRYIIVVSFISTAFVVRKLWMFKCFPTNKKYQFGELLGGFWALRLVYNSPKYSQILSKFGTVMQTIISHHIYYDFWNSFENSKEISPKTNFLGFLRRFLGHARNVVQKIFPPNESFHRDTQSCQVSSS